MLLSVIFPTCNTATNLGIIGTSPSHEHGKKFDSVSDVKKVTIHYKIFVTCSDPKYWLLTLKTIH